MVLIGIIRNHRIGVDIVKIDPFFQYQDIAEYILTPAEKTFMQRIRPASRYQVFFRIWAIKEAIIKATGETLAIIREIDTSEIIQDLFSYRCCSIQFSVQHPEYFVWQTFCEPDHHGVIAVEIGNSS
jgi:4'-phosphopantetheinyl transferase